MNDPYSEPAEHLDWTRRLSYLQKSAESSELFSQKPLS